MIFLSVQDVLDLHIEQIAGYGGDPGVRDRGLLESAVALHSLAGLCRLPLIPSPQPQVVRAQIRRG